MPDDFPVLRDEDFLGRITGFGTFGGDELDALRRLDVVPGRDELLLRSGGPASPEGFSLLPETLLGPLLDVLQVLVEYSRLSVLAGIQSLRSLWDDPRLSPGGQPLPVSVHSVPVGLDLPELQ